MYGNVGYGKNIFVLKYLRAMIQIGIERERLWKKNPAMFKGIQPPVIKGLSNFHIWNRPDDPQPEITCQPGELIPENLKLPFIDYMTIDGFLDLEGEEGVRYHLLVDEPYAWGLEARRSGSDIAVEMTRKSLQSRKTGVRGKAGRDSGSDIFGLTQLPSSMDKRLKFLARAVYLALPPDEFGFHYLYMGKIYRVHHVAMDDAIKNIFPYYDTYEKIEMTFSKEFMQSTGNQAYSEEDFKEGQKKDERLIEMGVKKVINDECMVTKDGIRLWKSLTKPDIWEQEKKRGGKIQR